ncbi:ribonuclease H-like domain-containing protein [Tanacetum coccineum]
MRTKLGVDSLSFNDLYNNLKVFESDVKGSTGSSSSAQNVAFVSSESTSSTNDVSTAYGVSTSSGYNSQRENSSSYTDELMYSFFANQSSGPHLDHEDLEQLDEFDLEEMDLKWQVAMISMRLKKFYKKTGRRLQFDAKEPVGFDKTKEEPKALVTLDGEGVDWTGHAEDEQENFALMAYSNSGLDTEVKSCSKECVESYAKLKKLYDEQREQLGDASIEIQAYTQALKKVEAQLVAHQKNQLWYEEKIRFMKIDLDDKTDVLTYHKKLLAEAVKEKEELKTKLENFQSSSKGLSKLLNSQMSTRDKSGLGYGDQVHNGVLSMHQFSPLNDRQLHPSDLDKKTSQQNRVAERKNRTLIEAARTMLADSFLPNTFWAEAVSTACYVLNRVLVTKPQNKTPYELITGKGPNWLFDLDYLTDSMNYQPVTVENKANKTAGPKEANHSAGTQDNIDAGNSEMETEPAQEYFVLPVWSSYTSTVKSSEAKNGDVKPNGDTGLKTNEEPKKYQEDQAFLRSLKA